MSYHAFGAGHPRASQTEADIARRELRDSLVAMLERVSARPIPRAGRGLSRSARLHPRRTLADDLGFSLNPREAHLYAELDPDLEGGSWPDFVDQTLIGTAMRGVQEHEDAEPDEPDTGIDDEPHDAREEDGI